MNCWELMNCPKDTRASCPAYPDHGHECWIVTDTKCAQGRIVKPTLQEKLAYCWTCKYYINYARRSEEAGPLAMQREQAKPGGLGDSTPPEAGA